MSTLTTSEAWQRVVGYASAEAATIYTVRNEVPNDVRYDPSREAIALRSRHHAASGEPFYVDRESFQTIWRQLKNGIVLSRDDVPEYGSLPALLDGTYRASGIMGLLNTVFDEIDAGTEPVRIWLEQ